MNEEKIYKFKVISQEYEPSFENFEKFGESIKSYKDCPCNAIRRLKIWDDFTGYILNIETLEVYCISNEKYGASQTQIYIKTLER